MHDHFSDANASKQNPIRSYFAYLHLLSRAHGIHNYCPLMLRCRLAFGAPTDIRQGRSPELQRSDHIIDALLPIDVTASIFPMNPDTNDIEPNAIPTGFEILPTGAALANVVTQTLLRNSLPDLNDKSKRFIPRSALFELFGSQQVKQLVELFLPQTDRTTLEELVNYICPEGSQCNRCERKSCTGGRVLFATLIWITRQDLIPRLLENPELCDSHQSSVNGGRSDTEMTWKSDLPQVEARLFDQFQLQLQAPFLESIGPQDTEAVTFEDAATLPWVAFETVHKPIPGNPCEVGEVHIHPAHHALVSLSSLSLLLDKQGVFLCYVL